MKNYIMVQVNESAHENQVLVFVSDMTDRFTKVVAKDIAYKHMYRCGGQPHQGRNIYRRTDDCLVLETALDSDEYAEMESAFISLPEFMEEHGLTLDWGSHSNPKKYDRKKVEAMIEDVASKIEAVK